MVRTVKRREAKSKKQHSSVVDSPSALPKQGKRSSRAGASTATNKPNTRNTRNSSAERKKGSLVTPPSVKRKTKSAATGKKNNKTAKNKKAPAASINEPLSLLSEPVCKLFSPADIRKEWGIPDAKLNLEKEAGKQEKSKNYLLAVLNQLPTETKVDLPTSPVETEAISAPPAPEADSAAEKPAPTPSPPVTPMDFKTVFEKPAPALVVATPTPPTPAAMDTEKPAPIPEKPAPPGPTAAFAPIPASPTAAPAVTPSPNPPNEDVEDVEAVDKEEEKLLAKHNRKFLEENPDMKELILKIEDMLLDFRSTNQNAMNQDNAQFQEGTTDLLDVYPVSKTKHMYKRYQEKFLAFASESKVNVKKMVEQKSKLTLDNFLTQFFVTQGLIYAPSSLYVIYSCINHWFISNHGFKLNGLLKLNRYLKAVTSSYVCKKSKVFSPEEIDALLLFCQESHDTEYTFLGVGVALMYYGLLRKSDVNKITIGDVSMDNKGRVKIEFNHSRKRKNPGFSYLIPSIYKKLFLKYESELCPELGASDTYLRRFTKCSNSRKTPIGDKTITKLVHTACEVLHKDPLGYTVHAFRRSAATNLADAGVSFVNLKRHGQWKSDSVCEGYIANSKALQNERLVMLLPEHRRITMEEATPPTFKDPILQDLHQKEEFEKKQNKNKTKLDQDSDSSMSSEGSPLAHLVSKTKKKRKDKKRKQAAINDFIEEDEVVFLKTIPAPQPHVIDVDEVESKPIIPISSMDLVASCSNNKTTPLEYSKMSFEDFLMFLENGNGNNGGKKNGAVFNNCTFNLKK